MPTYPRINRLIASWSPLLQKAFLDSIANLRSEAEVEEITRMLEAGDIEGALDAVHLNEASYRPLDRAVGEAFEAGGTITARSLPSVRTAEGLRAKFQFNVRNPRAETWLKDYSSTLVREIMDDQRDAIRNFLRANMEAGNNPRATALDLVGRIGTNGSREGGILGLTSSQEAWVRNYEAELRSASPTSALVRELRDRRFDAAVKRAAEAGEAIPEDLLSKMVQSYRTRALRFRAEAVGRTEAMASLHESQEQSMAQAVEAGLFETKNVVQIWRTAHDNRVRDSHNSMDGQTVPMGEDFVTGDGNTLRFPGDPNGPPEEVINCRCFREFKVDFLAGIS